MIFIFMSLFFQSPSIASRLEGGEPGNLKRSCDQAALNECRARAEIAQRECRDRARSYELQENIVLVDLNSRRENLAELNAASLSGDQQARAAGAELQFLDDLSKKRGNDDAFFPGSPSLQKLFLMDQLSMTWQEQFPEQYRLKLKDQELELAIFRRKISTHRSEIESEINSMLGTQGFYSGEKIRWQNDLSTHAYMWEKGCRDQVCPHNF